MGFNVREGGASSMWIEMKRLRGKPILRVGEIAADAVYGPKVITGTFNDASLYASRRVLPVTLQCDGEEPSVIGHISIDAQAPTQ